MSGTLFVVATPIGNLEDVSARAVRVLREVAVIAAEDTRRTSHLLARYGIQTSLTSLHEHNEREKAASLLSRLAGGESVAVVSDAGTPTISDPGSHLIASAIEAGIRVESVPGPSAILALLAVSGLPTQPFTFLGFVPNRSKDRAGWIRRLKDVPGTSVFFESPHRLHQTLDAISDQYSECHIVVGRELTKVHEEVLRGPVSAVKKKLGEPRGEFCLAINLTMWAVSSDEPEGQAVDDAAIGTCFRQITETAPLSRRAAIAAVSKRLGVAPNKIYAALERQKTSVE